MFRSLAIALILMVVLAGSVAAEGRSIRDRNQSNAAPTPTAALVTGPAAPARPASGQAPRSLRGATTAPPAAAPPAVAPPVATVAPSTPNLGGTTTYTQLAIIPRAIVVGGTPVALTQPEIDTAIAVALSLGPAVSQASNGGGTVATTVVYVDSIRANSPIGTGVWPSSGDTRELQASLGANGYDVVGVYGPNRITGAGLGGAAQARYFFVNSGETYHEELTFRALHEFGHTVEFWLTSRGYTGVTPCGGGNLSYLMHCAAPFGYVQNTMAWYRAYYQALLPGARGIGPAGWGLGTPTNPA